RELADDLHEAPDVRVIQRGVDRVEDAERTRLHQIDRKQQGDRRQRLFAARQLGQDTRALALWPSHDLDGGFQRILGVLEDYLRRSFVSEEVGEQRAEIRAHLLERFHETVGCRGVDLLDRRQKGLFGFDQVRQLL